MDDTVTYKKKTEPLVVNNAVIKEALDAVKDRVDTSKLYVGERDGWFGPIPGTYIRIRQPVRNMRGIDTNDDDENELTGMNCSPFLRVFIDNGRVGSKIGNRGGWHTPSSKIYGKENFACKGFPPGTYLEFETDMKYESAINLLTVLLLNGNKDVLPQMRELVFSALNKIMNIGSGSIELVGEEETVQRIISTITTKDDRLINRHVLLYGSPGCGKSEIVKEVIRRTPEWIHYPLGHDSDEWEEFVQSLDKLMKFLGRNALIIADEIDENGLTRAVDREKVYRLLRVLDGVQDIGNVKFIATTNRAADLDEALLRVGRLGPAIRIAAPDDAKRRAILKFYNDRYEGEVNIGQAMSKMDTASGAEIRAAFETCILLKKKVTTQNVVKAYEEIKEAI